MPIGPPAARVSPAVLPPHEREPGELSRLLADATIGLPEGEGETEQYRPRLSLDSVGQPYITAGVDPFGTFVGGGIAFLWSDMLGNHNLTAAVQTDTSFGRMSDIAKNTAGHARLHQPDASLELGRVGAADAVSRAAACRRGLDCPTGRLVQVDETTIVRQTSRALTGIAAYPFSRARRVEFGGGYDARCRSSSRSNTVLTSLTTGHVLVEHARQPRRLRRH